MNEEVLVHHGVLGMKWGVRRYQNADGSLTAAGRQHYNVGAARNKSAGKAKPKEYPSYDEMQKVVKQKTMEKAYDKATDKNVPGIVTNVANTSQSSLNSVRNAYTDYKRSKLPPVDTSNMTNRELQDAVTRMNLEDNYVRLVQNREYAKQGKDWVEMAIDSLDEVADVAKIAASVATVIALVAKVKG